MSLATQLEYAFSFIETHLSLKGEQKVSSRSPFKKFLELLSVPAMVLLASVLQFFYDFCESWQRRATLKPALLPVRAKSKPFRHF